MQKPDASLTPVEGPADTELITRILAGDMRAFEALMRLYNRTLYRTARAILRDDAEAQDAVQDAYLRAYGALGSFRGDAKLSTWLVRITVNEALMRRRRRTLPGALAAPAHANSETLADEAADPEADAERSQMRRLLQSRIDALPDGYRTVFVLRGVQEMSVEEVAQALDIPEATVRTRFFRARGLLRTAMASDIDTTAKDAFSFAGVRCDRIVAFVLSRTARLEAALC
jgi:RNA polymerase sigma-70 factor (ECF subfamily)